MARLPGSKRLAATFTIVAFAAAGCAIAGSQSDLGPRVTAARAALLTITEPTGFDEGVNPLFRSDSCPLWRDDSVAASMSGAEHHLDCVIDLDHNSPSGDASAIVVANLIVSENQLTFADRMTRGGNWSSDPARSLLVDGEQLTHRCYTKQDPSDPAAMCIATFRSDDVEIAIVGLGKNPESVSGLLESELVSILDQLATFELGDFVDLSLYGDCYSAIPEDC